MRYPFSQILSLCEKIQATYLSQERIQQIASSSPSRYKEIEKLKKAKVLLLTSGTTQKPKIVSLPISSLFYNAFSCCDKLFLERKDQYLLTLPLYHVSGLAILFRSFLQTAAVRIFPTSEAWLQNKGHTHVSLVPTQLYRLLKLPFSALSAWKSSVKTVLIGGARCPYLLYERAKQAGLPLYLSYGMTEMGSQVLLNRQLTWKNGVPYLGFPSPLQKLCLSPEKEILLKGASSFEGYLFHPSVFNDQGWFASKDIAHYDEEKGYAILGRKDRMFISGGENIHPEEMERHLESFSGVQQAYVTCQADEEFGEIAVAYIQWEQQEQKTRLLSFLKKRLPSYKIPKKIFPWSALKKTDLKSNA